ncbi:hypothetical protein SIO70_19150 [Chitinophaga sancti]|uniref:hypothetical protein n=1 Tax=Chitinophaga sancti TaxID=1004 RepID=UPI002A74B0E4|nr:hypothetical protein [Chitinophaga sancti]WPQ60468.1 hypothetical protein SIO70_19150 [Chitinophaga sancti]
MKIGAKVSMVAIFAVSVALQVLGNGFQPVDIELLKFINLQRIRGLHPSSRQVS